MGEPVERMRISMTEGVGIIPGNGGEFVFRQSATEWARVDKDLNVTHLDMELCRKGPQNEYTALALAIWDAATEAAQKEWQGLSDQEIVDLLNKYFHSYPDLIHVVHMIEAKLKEKNG
jgi:hypothetical protein